MKLQELKAVKDALKLPIISCTNRLRWEEYDDADDRAEMVWQLATAVTVEADLKDHLFALECVLEICEAVAKGRYLEDCQRCHWGDHRCEHQCTANMQHCDGFDERDPYMAIADWLEDLRPFRDEVRAWIEAQLPLQRGMREALWGPQGLFGGGQVIDLDAGRVLTSDEAATRQAEHADKEDRAHEAMALRIDQYVLNLEHIRRICQGKGDLQAVVSIITEGLPPQLRQPINPS
jgi:hypothetical protein